MEYSHGLPPNYSRRTKNLWAKAQGKHQVSCMCAEAPVQVRISLLSTGDSFANCWASNNAVFMAAAFHVSHKHSEFHASHVILWPSMQTCDLSGKSQISMRYLNPGLHNSKSESHKILDPDNSDVLTESCAFFSRQALQHRHPPPHAAQEHQTSLWHTQPTAGRGLRCP